MEDYTNFMLERTIKAVVEDVSKDYPVILLTGMRQIGKTTLLTQMSSTRNYISLDDWSVREMATNDPKLFLQTYKPPIIIDEVQYAPQLFTYIKIWIDEHNIEYMKGNKDANPDGAFWLTGSQKFGLIKGIQESLAGRVCIIDMLGLSYKEIIKEPFNSQKFIPSRDMITKESKLKKLDIFEVYKIIFNGSFPKLITKESDKRERFYKSYLQTYIERDVMQDLNIKNNELKFYNFIRAVAVRTGNLLNYTDIAKDVEIDVKTAKIWLNTLEKSGIIKLLEPYYINITKRITKTPKVYFLDTGLCSYLAGIHTPEALENSYLNGRILETYVFCEILKSYWHNGEEPNIYFYRDNEQREVDFLIERDLVLYPIEVKKTASPKSDDAKNFKFVEKLNKEVGVGAVICLCDRVMPIGEKNISVPVWEI
ncbi:MAG: ATP-binding protein [Rickettsiales bacterium]|nr:MAG: ATP-binding protein [Rickettsiales bacterium]